VSDCRRRLGGRYLMNRCDRIQIRHMSLLLGDDGDLRAALSDATEHATTSDRDGLVTSAIIDIEMGPLQTPLLRAVLGRSRLSAASPTLRFEAALGASTHRG
jgi:hypothetical protein